MSDNGTTKKPKLRLRLTLGSGKGKDNGTAPGAMAEVGEHDKGRRYGAQALPLAVETYGRMGAESRACLRQLAWDASTVQF